MSAPAQVLLPVGRCRLCALARYPESVGGCPRCGSAEVSTDRIDAAGTVWTFTVQRYAPKSPPFASTGAVFRPFVVAYVETVNGLRVAGIIESDPGAVRIGSRVELVSADDVPRFRLVAAEADRRTAL